MKLTMTERLILYNQYRILKKLYPEEADQFKAAEEILFNGYEYNYETLVENFSDGLPEQISKEVYDILQMYRSLYFSYKNLPDKTGIDENDVIFEGFDGNEETKHFVYAKFLIKTQGLYEEFRNVEINSHWPKLEKYRKMLAVWSKHDRYQELSKDQILEIINI